MAQDLSLFDRPELSARMGSRRRLPRLTATSPSQTASNAFPDLPQVVVTFMDVFDDDETFEPAANGVPGPSTPSPFGIFNSFDARPGNEFSSDAFVIESGWTKDVFGHDIYVGHGKIEEVVDESGGSSSHDHINEDNFATPLTKFTELSLPPGSMLAESIPGNSTPPPCPRRLKKLPSLRATSSLSLSDLPRSFNATSSITPLPPMPPFTSRGTSIALDDATEVSLVKEMLDLLNSSNEDIKFLDTYFHANSKSLEHDLSQHIDICTRVEKSLADLRYAFTQRAQIGAEEWGVRSSSWHQKYCRRLLSLRITLQRLSRLRQVVEKQQPLRPGQRQTVLTKLEQHEAKLADLASKYTRAFDRLRLRHLHFLLTQSHMEARQLKAQNARLSPRASFERRWKEGKSLRATLRLAYYDLRQEFYGNNQRSGRHTPQ